MKEIDNGLRLIVSDPELNVGIRTGLYNASKATIRDVKTGRIVGSGDLVKKVDNAKDAASSLLHSKWFLIGLGAIVCVGAAAGVVHLVSKKKNKDNNVEVPICVSNFDKKFKKYLKEAQKGKLNVKTIDGVLSSLNEIEKVQIDDLKIDFNTKELKTLIQDIYKYTNDLAKNSDISTNKIEEPCNDNIINLKDYLNVQKEIIEKSS